MATQEILEKAIAKAIDGGLTGYWTDRYKSCQELDEMEYLTAGNNMEHGMTIEKLIFNHDFAKALWGEQQPTTYEQHYIPARGYPGEHISKDKIEDSSNSENWNCKRCSKAWSKCFDKPCNLVEEGNIGWKHHLQQMVIADDPIQYLGENI